MIIKFIYSKKFHLKIIFFIILFIPIKGMYKLIFSNLTNFLVLNENT